MKANLPVSIADVARSAGVSSATVSRILNGKLLNRFSQSTQDTVWNAAAELGYRPNAFARSLREGKTSTIGLMISGLENPYFVALAEHGVLSVTAHGYRATIDSGASVRGSYADHPHIDNWPVDAVILWAAADQSVSDYLGSYSDHIPTVYLGYERFDDTDFVVYDLAKGILDCITHLHERGYRRPCYISPYDFAAREDPDPRVSSYFNACKQYGLEANYRVLGKHEETPRVGRQMGLDLASLPKHERPDVVIAHNDVLAIGIYHGLIRGGLRIPEDIALTGCDGIEFGQILAKPLTTIDAPAGLMIETAISILTRRMADREAPSQGVILSPTLLIGETT